jgi:hypothetical protein
MAVAAGVAAAATHRPPADWQSRNAGIMSKLLGVDGQANQTRVTQSMPFGGTTELER